MGNSITSGGESQHAEMPHASVTRRATTTVRLGECEVDKQRSLRVTGTQCIEVLHVSGCACHDVLCSGMSAQILRLGMGDSDQHHLDAARQGRECTRSLLSRVWEVAPHDGAVTPVACTEDEPL